MRELQSGLVTFVFTDIEGSTRLFQSLGSRFHDVLGDHNVRLRVAFSSHGGVEVKTTGDGFFVAFSEADSAVAACVAAQLSLRQSTWAEECGVRVRMGIHATESEPVDGDYVSVGAHHAARIMAAAHGGQILASEAAAGLVSSLPAHSRLDLLGQFRLRDFDDPVELYQVCHRDLPVDFPMVAATPAKAHNVAMERSPLVGRGDDLARLRQALAAQRLVTIVGPGGVGKTSIAAQVVRESALDYPDGGWLVDLAPLTDGDAVAEATALALGVAESAGGSALESLVAWLRSRRLLLVLDNCEHLIEACGALVTAVLDRTEKASVLATSREPLGLVGERVYRLEPLAVPDADDAQGDLIRSPAVRLFLDRAAEARPGFEPEAGDVEAAAALCRSVDGLPLAIELAAAHVRALSPGEVLEQIQRGASLRSAARDAPPRHRSLTDVIDWSYQLLDAEERPVFRGCAIFAGGFSLEAALEVLAETAPPPEVMSRLYGLHNRSLLERADGTFGTRFRLLEPVRQHCAGLLGIDERAGLARRHADWAIQMVREAEPGLRSKEQRAWLDRLDEERPNLVAALAWLRDEGQRDQFSTLALGLAGYWFVRGSKHEGLRWLSEVIDFSSDESMLIGACCEAAKLAHLLGDFDQGDRLARQAIAAADHAGMPAAAANAWNTLGVNAEARGDGTAARKCLDRGLRLARDGGDTHEEVSCLVSLAQFELEVDDLDSARGHVTEAVRLADRDGTPGLRMRALDVSGRVAFDETRFGDALSFRREALEVARALGDRRYIAWCHVDVGRSLTYLGHYQEAASHLDTAIRMSRLESVERAGLDARLVRAELARHRGDIPAAVAEALEGLSLALQIEDRWDLHCHLEGLGEGLVLAGEFERAAILFGAAAAARDVTGVSVGPVEGAELEVSEARARAALGARFDELVAAGRADTGDEALRALLRREQAAEVPNELRREADGWVMSYAGKTAKVADLKGLHDLAVLLARPGQEVHVLDLAGRPAETGVAILDATARHQYRVRLADLEEDIADAERVGNTEQEARAREEHQTITAALTSAYGLGGRERQTSDAGERARKAVTRRIRQAIAKLEPAHPTLARHLDQAVVTGFFCSYRPSGAVRWAVRSGPTARKSLQPKVAADGLE